MRGALELDQHARVHPGIIPAYAGSTTRLTRPGSCKGDHPRVCGEHVAIQSVEPLIAGSSPRMRGALPGPVLGALHIRIIPAYAGSTAIPPRASGTQRDHPRVCGEHSCTLHWRNPSWGSSPRMRGALAQAFDAVADMRIIPAYAGSTYGVWARHGGCEDHPRVCGEHTYVGACRMLVEGSSPRMRGALPLITRLNLLRGIIPAYAGSTSSQSWWIPLPTDHPRVCGEHTGLTVSCLPRPGSSPRMRGAQELFKRVNDPAGIIPAYAGSTRTCLLMVS